MSFRNKSKFLLDLQETSSNLIDYIFEKQLDKLSPLQVKDIISEYANKNQYTVDSYDVTLNNEEEKSVVNSNIEQSRDSDLNFNEIEAIKNQFQAYKYLIESFK